MNGNEQHMVNQLKPDQKSDHDKPKIKFVSHLPDLMTIQDYSKPCDKKKVKIRIEMTDAGIDIIGDSMYDFLLEDILSNAGAKEIERVLCG